MAAISGSIKQWEANDQIAWLRLTRPSEVGRSLLAAFYLLPAGRRLLRMRCLQPFF